MNDLAEAADIVLPGCRVGRKGCDVRERAGAAAGRVARVIPPPGDAQEDWQVFVNVGLALGGAVTYTNSAEIRAELAAAMASEHALRRAWRR